MRGDKAVRKIQELLSNWNLELDAWGMLSEEHSTLTWIESFRAYAVGNKDKTAEELRREILMLAKGIEGMEFNSSSKITEEQE